MTISKILLWLFVIVFSIELGGGLYETLVVVPTWAGNPPDSVIAFYQNNAAKPDLALNAGPKFWMFCTPLTGLTAIGAFLSGLRTNPVHRHWRVLGTGLAIIVVVWTFAWFVPNIMRLFSEEVLTMNPADLSALANRWASLNWLRVVLYSAGFLATLKAFGTPSEWVQTPTSG
jgi:Domain of unknown function (DUF1772)